MNTPEGHAARIAILERMAVEGKDEARELRVDIRNLTAAVAELSKSVAVLSQKLADQPGRDAHPAVSVGAGGVGGGLVAGIIEALQRIHW